MGSRANREEVERVPLRKTGVVAQFEFVGWTEGEHLRHTRYIGLRDEKDTDAVLKET